MCNQSKYFSNPQFRFRTFYNCESKLKYTIHDYVKSGFYFIQPKTIICYNCGLSNKLLIHEDPCLIHKRNDQYCIYSIERECHVSGSGAEIYLIIIILCIVLMCSIIPLGVMCK